jgi:GcrA cell cycle regulator
MSEWTAERTQRLRDDWAAGLPGSAIAARLDVTRATIMGKVRRLKLATRKLQAKTGRPPRAPEQAPPIPPHLTPPTIWATLYGLAPGECRWPLGARDFVFCALPADGGPYCACHARIAYQPSRVREAA